MPMITMRHADRQVITHISGGISDYATLCGIAEDGDEDSAVEVTPTRKRITCEHCHQLWATAREFTGKDFSKALT